jgi:hypothetical protein
MEEGLIKRNLEEIKNPPATKKEIKELKKNMKKRNLASVSKLLNEFEFPEEVIIETLNIAMKQSFKDAKNIKTEETEKKFEYFYHLIFSALAGRLSETTRNIIITNQIETYLKEKIFPGLIPSLLEQLSNETKTKETERVLNTYLQRGMVNEKWIWQVVKMAESLPEDLKNQMLIKIAEKTVELFGASAFEDGMAEVVLEKLPKEIAIQEITNIAKKSIKEKDDRVLGKAVMYIKEKFPQQADKIIYELGKWAISEEELSYHILHNTNFQKELLIARDTKRIPKELVKLIEKGGLDNFREAEELLRFSHLPEELYMQLRKRLYEAERTFFGIEIKIGEITQIEKYINKEKFELALERLQEEFPSQKVIIKEITEKSKNGKLKEALEELITFARINIRVGGFPNPGEDSIAFLLETKCISQPLLSEVIAEIAKEYTLRGDFSFALKLVDELVEEPMKSELKRQIQEEKKAEDLRSLTKELRNVERPRDDKEITKELKNKIKRRMKEKDYREAVEIAEKIPDERERRKELENIYKKVHRKALLIKFTADVPEHRLSSYSKMILSLDSKLNKQLKEEAKGGVVQKIKEEFGNKLRVGVENIENKMKSLVG